jgi:hypothetical protein
MHRHALMLLYKTPASTHPVTKQIHMSQVLPSTIRPGLVNVAGTPESRKLVEAFLQEDRQKHHCFWGRASLHNHLSHQ